MPLIYWCQAHVGAGELGGENAVRGGSLKRGLHGEMGKGGDEGGKQEQRTRGEGARGRLCGRGGAGAAPPDLDQSPLLRFQAPCCRSEG